MPFDLKPCPFCGGSAEVEREGTPRRSCIVACTECGAQLESNETGAGHDWNHRVTPEQAKLAELEEWGEAWTTWHAHALACPVCRPTGGWGPEECEEGVTLRERWTSLEASARVPSVATL